MTLNRSCPCPSSSCFFFLAAYICSREHQLTPLVWGLEVDNGWINRHHPFQRCGGMLHPNMSGPMQSAKRLPTRLKPPAVSRDPLESVGFVSKGDKQYVHPSIQRRVYIKLTRHSQIVGLQCPGGVLRQDRRTVHAVLRSEFQGSGCSVRLSSHHSLE